MPLINEGADDALNPDELDSTHEVVGNVSGTGFVDTYYAIADDAQACSSLSYSSQAKPKAKDFKGLMGSYKVCVKIVSAKGAVAYGQSSTVTVVFDHWKPISTTAAPSARNMHAAVWTGSKMIVWGGGTQLESVNTGGVYDPLTNTWTPTSTVNAPIARHYPGMVWTGSKMIVWGGFHLGTGTRVSDGALYDPELDAWAPMASLNAPSPREGHVMVWAGSKLIVWGGQIDGVTIADDGALYDPANDTWSPMAPAPIAARVRAGYAWTGTELIIWGGHDLAGGVFNTGAIYNPASNSWRTMTLMDAPNGRMLSGCAHWTGEKFIIWGGVSGSGAEASGGLYDPTTDTWSALPSNPKSGSAAACVFTGSKLLVWSGVDGAGAYTQSGATYDIATNTWEDTDSTDMDLLSKRAYAASVWTGSSMIVWGGINTDNWAVVGDGAIHQVRPRTLNYWQPTSTTNAPAGGIYTASVWTGAEFFTWGGSQAGGGLYDPKTDIWRPLSAVNAPANRMAAVSVWTGSKVLIFGGIDLATSTFFNDGFSYDVASDTWGVIPPAPLPDPRALPHVVWTGSKMIVWGGQAAASALGDGAIYDPATNTWSAMSSVNAPAARLLASVVWTGSKMIVWGGRDLINPAGFSDGAIYDPETDSWSAMTMTDAPNQRSYQCTTWTGSQMAVWGGTNGSGGQFNTGGLYDPVANVWKPITMNNAPEARTGCAMVWTGKKAIVYGGGDNNGVIRTDAMYDPQHDTWTMIDQNDPNVPERRSSAAGAWLGDRMLIWGGTSVIGPELNTGGIYKWIQQ